MSDYFDYAHLPLGDLDTAVQSALISDDPQRAVTDLVKRYAARMAGDLRALPMRRKRRDGSPHLLARDVYRILDDWTKP